MITAQIRNRGFVGRCFCPDPRSSRSAWGEASVAGHFTLVFLGLLALIREMTVLMRWAEIHWDQWCQPLGFDRQQPPHATTLSRTIARSSLGDFSRAFALCGGSHQPINLSRRKINPGAPGDLD